MEEPFKRYVVNGDVTAVNVPFVGEVYVNPLRLSDPTVPRMNTVPGLWREPPMELSPLDPGPEVELTVEHAESSKRHAPAAASTAQLTRFRLSPKGFRLPDTIIANGMSPPATLIVAR